MRKIKLYMNKQITRWKKTKFYINFMLPIINYIKRKVIQTKENLKVLGWFWGGICLLIGGIIFYSPAIYYVVMYFITGNAWYWVKAGSYVAWWFLPAASPAMVTYLFIVFWITVIAIKIKKLFIRRSIYETKRSVSVQGKS